jgi:hypothetical protein
MRHRFCCANCPNVPALVRCIDDSREITRRTFRRHVNHESLEDLEASLGYESHPSRGLTMAGDWYVTYHKSTYKGRPCVYLRYSGIEYLFF